MIKFLSGLIITVLSIGFATSGFCEPINWKIDVPKSEIKFKATQNNSPVIGEFNKFSGNIIFDEDNPKNSNIEIIINMGSVSTSYVDVSNTLITKNWFDIKSFPNAVFKAAEFKKTKNNSYQANGSLTIKGITQPIVLEFIFDEYSDKTAIAKGSATIKRTSFNVGQGEWEDTTAIKNEVEVIFLITANKIK